PEFVTWLPMIEMLLEPVIYIPYDVVPVTVKPWMMMKLRLEIRNPSAFPVTVTAALPLGRYRIGAPDVPERAGVTCSLYVPALTSTVSPATAADAAALIVQ